MKSISLLLIFTALFLSQKEYVKNYYPNKKLKEEGWIENGTKTDYWFYYYENGNKKEEGHYKNNLKTYWWIYYDEKQRILKKCEYKKNKLNGLTIVYNKEKIVKAEKYSDGKKIKTWTDFNEFKRDNDYKQ